MHGSVSPSPRGAYALKAKSQGLTSPGQPFPVAEVMDEREREGGGRTERSSSLQGLGWESIYTDT